VNWPPRTADTEETTLVLTFAQSTTPFTVALNTDAHAPRAKGSTETFKASRGTNKSAGRTNWPDIRWAGFAGKHVLNRAVNTRKLIILRYDSTYGGEMSQNTTLEPPKTTLNQRATTFTFGGARDVVAPLTIHSRMNKAKPVTAFTADWLKLRGWHNGRS
jgi:hypothetical protein